MGKKAISTKEFDEKFERGEDLADHLDWDKGTKAFSMRMPLWMVRTIDREAARIGNSRQGLINAWLADKIDALGSAKGKESA